MPAEWNVERVFVRDQIHVTGVSLNKTSLSLIKGNSEKLTATVTPSDADIKDLIWSSTDSLIVNVDQEGNVRAIAGGSASIKVRSVDGNKQDICQVNVIVPVTSVSLNKSTLSFSTIGSFEKLIPTIGPEDATNKSVTWESSNTGVATVSSDGTVTAKGPGTAVITVSSVDGNKQAQCTVSVAISVTSVTLDKESVTLTKGSSVTLYPTINPSNATNKAVEWLSDNTDVATVDANGNVTAKAAGSATITVITADGGYRASCTVTVVSSLETIIGGREGNEHNW